MNRRLEQFMKAENLTSAKFAEILSVQPSSISHLLSGRNKPNFDFIAKLLLMFPQLNPHWIINGQGAMYIEANNDFAGRNIAPISSPVPTDIFNLPAAEFQHQIPENKVIDPVNSVTTIDNFSSQSNAPESATSANRSNENQSDKHTAELNGLITDNNEELKQPTTRNVDRVLLLYNDHTFEFFNSAII